METHLTLKHLAPYLPYGLKYVNTENTEYTFKVDCAYNTHVVLRDDDSGLQDVYFCEENPHLMPILYPLSWLTKEIEHNGKKCYVIDKIIHPSNVEMLGGYKEIYDTWVKNGVITHALTLGAWNTLFEHHFNVFNLPEHLYINKATLKDNG